MLSAKRNDIFLYAISIGLCAASYFILNYNIELSLLPHKTVLEFIFDFDLVFIDNVGYEQTNGLFTIARNCLGVKLFINLFLIMVFGFLHKYEGLKHKAAAMMRFYMISFALAFVITVVRISASVPFCTCDRFHLIHNTLSLGIYFAAGLIVYFVMERKTTSMKESAVTL
ncbi:MAG: exosortase K [Oscillospiraceae bacterium]|nr:exosortase K [Oscillospiraceae bacterium]